MIRKAVQSDIEKIEMIYNEIFKYEKENTCYTNWQKGLYPTIATAQKALDNDWLFVGEKDGEIYGSMVLNSVEPTEYANLDWGEVYKQEEILVIHTLSVSPSFFGQGLGIEFVKFSENYARENGYKIIRLDTYEKNYPALKMYETLNYTYVGSTLFNFEGVIVETLKCFKKEF